MQEPDSSKQLKLKDWLILIILILSYADLILNKGSLIIYIYIYILYKHVYIVYN